MNGSTDIVMGTISRRSRRYQKGQLIKRYGSWHVRYRGWSQNQAGERVWRAQSTVLGRLKDYPTKAKIWNDYVSFMAEINRLNLDLRDCDPDLIDFIERVYLPSPAVQSLEKSTINGYSDIFRLHLKPLLLNQTLAGFRPVNVARLLEQLAQEKDFSKTTLQHIKSFLSGIYTYARTHGHFDGANPVTGVKLPKAKPPAETYAYSLEEERLMMKAVSSLKARLALAVASWTGVDKGELEGLRWEDRKGADLYITRKIWEGNEKDPKAEKRRAPIPIIPHMQKMMDAYWKGAGSPPEGWIFTASRGEKPIRMDNLAKREIIPDLKKAGLEWHGWHAFRRGLATNLREMGVPDDILQRILRHSDVATTQRHYAKTLPKSVRKAMAKLDRKLKAG
jgi:integrase